MNLDEKELLILSNPHISSQYDLKNADWLEVSKKILDQDGVLVLENFLTEQAIATIKREGEAKMNDAYFCESKHNVYLTDPDKDYAMDHPRNFEVVSSKGLIGDDQVADNSPLKEVYRDETFQQAISYLVGESAIYPYADPLSSVNLHFAKTGQELGWHFDNSSFAITLLIDKPEAVG